MPRSNQEALVILRSALSVDVAEAVAPLAQVTQGISPRVALVDLDPGALETLRERSEVEHVLPSGATPDGPLPALNAMETLFVEGFLGRRSKDEEERPGEGLDWDPPGRSAP